MSGMRRRLLRALGDEARPEAQLDEEFRAALERQETLVRELTSDLAERVAALERRLQALERDR